MNLWAKSLGQFAFLAIALSFFSCEDDTIQGYKTNPKFKVSYKEFVLPSSVIQLDSIRTSNFFFASETNGLLLGQYMDPVFGNVKADFYTQFYAVNPVSINGTSQFDSVSLELAFDLYSYGGYSSHEQNVTVYELSENLYDENTIDYTNETSTATRPSPLAMHAFSVDAQQFDEWLEDRKDTTLTVQFRLPNTFGQRIFNVVKDFSTGGTDSSKFASREEFLAEFKGIAVKSDGGDKIVRFNPRSAETRLRIHYHTSTDTVDYQFSFVNQVNYSQISFDRSGTALAGIVNKYEEYLTDDPFRYIQSGSGLVTKIDLKPFLDFVKSEDNILLNGVELVAEDVVTNSALTPPAALAVRAIDSASNRLKKYAANNPQDLFDIVSYSGYLLADFASRFTNTAIQIERDSAFYVVNDIGSSSVLAYDETSKSYSGFVTSFFQQLTYNDGRSHLRYFVLYPTIPSGAKSVDRAVFPADKIKLRIYYTTPLE